MSGEKKAIGFFIFIFVDFKCHTTITLTIYLKSTRKDVQNFMKCEKCEKGENNIKSR